ncbi:DUF421 domain-containing protein [Thalassobacillus hwangdonensis]|uniref:DUF421 domain-containing protein n=1 Tax=Thalassobacillus hwangdonensis TaxID=546108 RepID=A0ABW3KZY5_9BACI
MDYIDILKETLFGFIALFFLTKVLGKSQITQITAFDFIAALVLGELVGNALFDPEVGVLQIGYAVLLWGVLIYVTEIITEKFKKTRAILEGKPSIVIHNGKIIKQQLKKSKLDINQLQHLLRSKEVFSFQEVAFAILETDGTVSVLKNSLNQTPSKGDFNMPAASVPLPTLLISDGEVLWDNLKEAGLDKRWLMDQLHRQEIEKYKEVLVAEYKKGEALYVQTY